MMGELDSRNRELVICCIICFFQFIQSTCAQEGFLSIQCCANAKFKDPITNISWIGDESWYPDRGSCEEITRPVYNNTDHSKARFFSSGDHNKWCYSLPTRKDQEYFVRGTFFGDLKRNREGALFDVFIGVTPVAQVKSSEKLEVEGIFRARGNRTNFCLFKREGEPYISKLELRPATPDYLKRESPHLLKVVETINAGNRGADIRYPYDPYDRIWESYSHSDPNAYIISNSNVTTERTNTTFPPLQVLQTALTHPERLEFLHNLDAEELNYTLFLYFLELNDSVQTGERVFDIYINDENRQEVDIVAGGLPDHAVVISFSANGFLNITMVKSTKGSLLGPICNAYEILQVHTWNEETPLEEATAIEDVKHELLEHNQGNKLLKTWSGDPCLPLPWLGLFCEIMNNTMVITKMNISFSDLTGPVPQSITKLLHLKELNLSNNKFTGHVPAFSASSRLASVDLRHNALTGDITESLNLLSYLTTLYFGCNANLSDKLPASLERANLSTDYGECPGQGSSHPNRGVLIGTVAGGSVLITIAITILLICLYKRKKMVTGTFNIKGHPMTKNAVYSIPSTESILLKSISIQNFTLEYIENATQKCRTLIGEGGFGSVYRGTLSDGQEVAVKIRASNSTQGTREFENELNLLSAIRHENLVPLLGYCCENDQQILVYPFMSNGSLQDRLYGEAAKRRTLDWPTRLSIAIGAARGLAHLHTFSARCVIHRDVKSSNILLDQSMCAKVADFGFSKYAPQEGDSGTSLEVRGTAGYLDPEYYSTQHLSTKSDVFSFGVVLLEIVSGREPLNVQRPRDQWSLVEWAKPHIRNSRIEEVVDPSIKGGYHAEAMWRVVEVALACIEPYSVNRPSMADIVRELEDALIIENNASEYMKSIDSFGGSTRFSIERSIIIPPTPVQTTPSPVSMQPAPPQPR